MEILRLDEACQSGEFDALSKKMTGSPKPPPAALPVPLGEGGRARKRIQDDGIADL